MGECFSPLTHSCITSSCSISRPSLRSKHKCTVSRLGSIDSSNWAASDWNRATWTKVQVQVQVQVRVQVQVQGKVQGQVQSQLQVPSESSHCERTGSIEP